MSKFHLFENVRHVKTGTVYKICGTPERFRLEKTNVPAYAYHKHDEPKTGVIWVRAQDEFEDGRFVLESPRNRSEDE